MLQAQFFLSYFTGIGDLTSRESRSITMGRMFKARPVQVYCCNRVIA